jgi:hypothetical protein
MIEDRRPVFGAILEFIFPNVSPRLPLCRGATLIFGTTDLRGDA